MVLPARRVPRQPLVSRHPGLASDSVGSPRDRNMRRGAAVSPRRVGTGPAAVLARPAGVVAAALDSLPWGRYLNKVFHRRV